MSNEHLKYLSPPPQPSPTAPNSFNPLAASAAVGSKGGKSKTWVKENHKGVTAAHPTIGFAGQVVAQIPTVPPAIRPSPPQCRDQRSWAQKSHPFQARIHKMSKEIIWEAEGGPNLSSNHPWASPRGPSMRGRA